MILYQDGDETIRLSLDQILKEQEEEDGFNTVYEGVEFSPGLESTKRESDLFTERAWME